MLFRIRELHALLQRCTHEDQYLREKRSHGHRGGKAYILRCLRAETRWTSSSSASRRRDSSSTATGMILRACAAFVFPERRSEQLQFTPALRLACVFLIRSANPPG
jgi:hypothetical protein